MLKKSLHSKILVLIIGFITVGIIISIYWELKNKELELLDEKLRASRFMAQPILNAIYDDMLEERADMARHLINAMSKANGIEGLYIVRSNGVEEAFKDFKTINAVKKEYGEIKPEWTTDHLDEPDNVARGVQTPEFKEAYEKLSHNWNGGAIHYVDNNGGKPVFTYLQPIDKKPKCNTCHSTEGARGILVIRTSLADMYGILHSGRNQWIISGILAITLGGVLLSVLIRRSVTGPIERNVGVIKRIAEGNAGMSERMEVTSEDEVGYLASAFNNMLDALVKRDEENRRLLELITQSKEEWVATFDAIQDLISIHDKDHRIIKINVALAKKLGVPPSEIINRKCHEIFYNSACPKRDCPHTKTLATGEASYAEADDLTFAGTYKISTFPVLDEKGEIWASVHIVRDITQDKLLREQLMQVEKLSSVGKLVAGIAHELNNPLMGIMGFSQLLLDMPGEKKLDDIKEKLRKIYHESQRTAKIVQNLLTFARTKKSERDYHNINTILKQTFEMRDYALKSGNIKIVMNLDPDLPKTMVDNFQIQQVFINIINNAEDAMTASNRKGTIEIKTSHARRKIRITFKDDGPGIPKEIISKVFDPFFTTKDIGKGTGLGLSITHGIITEHSGTIDITSPEGGGTLVTMDIPIVEKQEWIEVQKALYTSAHTASGFNGNSVLVADDESNIREILTDTLVKEGFKVDAVADGGEALEKLKDGRYSIVITDIKMPGVGGDELYDRIKKDYPNLKDRVIILTGDVFSDATADIIAKTGCPHILKPFDTKELLSLIRKMLKPDDDGGDA